MPKTILMLATFGLEIVEVGGTLALHAQGGIASMPPCCCRGMTAARR